MFARYSGSSVGIGGKWDTRPGPHPKAARRSRTRDSRAGRPLCAARRARRTLFPALPHKEASQLLGCHPRRPRPAKRVEDEIPLPGRGQKGTPHEPQGSLSGMITVKFLLAQNGADADRGHLGARVGSVYEVVVEGVA